MKKLLTVKELCDIFSVRRETICRWQKMGLPFIKVMGIVRFDENDVIGWIEKYGER